MADLERVAGLAKKFLSVATEGGKTDTWVWQHSERVMRLARMIAALPELANAPLNRDALAAACLFHDAGWVVQFPSGGGDRWQLLARPTTDIQRELGAAALREQAGHLLSGATLDTAVEAIRRCNLRHPGLAEAQVLAEAESLDEVGAIHLVQQMRLQQADGRGIDQFLSAWRRQQEYGYWEARIKDSFRFEGVMQLARMRLAAVDRFMSALGAEHEGGDLLRLIEALGVDASEVQAI